MANIPSGTRCSLATITKHDQAVQEIDSSKGIGQQILSISPSAIGGTDHDEGLHLDEATLAKNHETITYRSTPPSPLY